MGHHPKSLPDSGVWFLERQIVTVHDFESRGYVLDVGGGGEGIIGLLKGPSVEKHGLTYNATLAADAGFQVIAQEQSGRALHLVLAKLEGEP